MGQFVWTDLLWLALVVANIGLWFWAARDNREALRLLNRAEEMIDRHMADLVVREHKVDRLLDEAIKLNMAVEKMAEAREAEFHANVVDRNR